MVMRIRLIQFIFTVQLWKLCSVKFIENESFVRLHRSNASQTNKILNQALSTNVLELQKQAPNSTSKNVKLQREIRMQRKLDRFEGRPFFYVQTRENVDVADNAKNASDRYYINYQQAYGIRYDPRKIKRSFTFKDATDDDEVLVTTEHVDVDVSATTATNGFPENDQDDGAYDTEEQYFITPMQNDTSLSTNLTEPSNYVDEPRPQSNVMATSSSKIEAALQHLNLKIKNLFSMGGKTNPSTQRFLNVFNIIKFENVPCVSSQPPLTQLNGTCYHKFECEELGGIAADSCAGGFGVCCVCECIFVIDCL